MKNLSMSLLVLSLLFIADVGMAAMPCNNVVGMAAPCAGFAMGVGLRPGAQSPCCSNLRLLAAAAARSLADKKAICNCLVNGMNRFPGVQDRLLSHLPSICNINVGFPVSTKINCNAIH